MTEDELLQRYGLHPDAQHLDHIRQLLAAESERERQSLGSGDTELMQHSRIQLFNAGDMSDVLTIWRAKKSGWDPFFSIDVQLLCGGGLAETTAYLAAEGSELAAAALAYLLECETAGNFAGFSVADQTAAYAGYYGTELNGER